MPINDGTVLCESFWGRRSDRHFEQCVVVAELFKGLKSFRQSFVVVLSDSTVIAAVFRVFALNVPSRR